MNIINYSEQRLLYDLFWAIFCGFLIGGERELRGKAAGISTHIMVIVGAMLFTFLSSEVDPNSRSRIAAQVVSGIGFLGAGLILKEGSNVLNLTTAASLWVSGAIGMSLGFDYHLVAVIVTIVVTLVPRIPKIRSSKKQHEA